MKGRLLRIIIFTVIIANVAMASIVVFHDVFNFTSSNSAIYVLRGWYGGIEVKRDLFIEEADRLIFKIDINRIFHSFMKGQAIARDNPVLELTWDDDEGIGDIKQFRPDGSVLSMAFSRFREESGDLHGLFLGGDLPYGDSSRSQWQDTSGFGYYDGSEWFHIWCASNEGFNISGEKVSAVPSLWKFLGSRVLKDTKEEVILESDHEIQMAGHAIRMKRIASFRAGDDYFILKVKFTNAGSAPLTYSYAYGDEPWVGRFGSSEGDVGWYKKGLVKYEKFISPSQNSYAGFWDIGNEVAGETKGYSGYANFIEWLSPNPSYVFFSNDFDDCCDELKPLSDKDNRVLNVVWLNKLLLEGESRTHTFALGMARPELEGGVPQKPETVVN
jgi:hypothetical protein